jgi:hypothetical protein
MTLGFSLHYAPTPCRQDPRSTEIQTSELPKIPLLAFTRDNPFRDSGVRVTKGFGLHSRLTNPDFRNDPTAQLTTINGSR